jgi:hypothetical protein
MRALIVATTALVGLSFGMAVNSRPAQAIGCLSGGAAGALAGHMAGHGILGAVGGCVAGHAWHKHRLNQDAYQDNDSYMRSRSQQDPDWNRNRYYK